MKTWTVAEARAYLPRLRSLLELIGVGLAEGPDPGTYVLRDGAEHAEAALAELVDKGVVLRQVGHGLVDFVWRGEDDEVRMLCWQLDEPDLEWWHRPEDGYAGRRRIEDITWREAQNEAAE